MKKELMMAVALGALMLAPAAASAADLSAAGTMNTTGNATVTSTADTTGNDTKTMGSGKGALSAQDNQFILKAAQGGMTEVKTSRLAKKKTDSTDVKNFANHMIEDHKKADDKLKSIAKKLDVKVPSDLDTEHQAELDQLKNAKGADFDQKFISVQDKEHNDAVNAFQTEADSGQNAQLTAFAKTTLPTLQEHMKEVKALEAKVPAAATSAQ